MKFLPELLVLARAGLEFHFAGSVRVLRERILVTLADFLQRKFRVQSLSQVATNQSIAATKIAAIRNRLAYTNASWICARFAAFA